MAIKGTNKFGKLDSSSEVFTAEQKAGGFC